MTTLGDTFARADNTDLNAANTGKTLNGSAATWQWTEVANDIEISSGLVRNVTTGAVCYARVEQDLASADHEVQAVIQNAISSVATRTGLMARFSASATTGYWFRTRQNDCLLYSVVAGVTTEIGTAASGTGTGSVLCKLKCVGSTITCTIDGVDVISVTDTSITSGVRVGIALIASNGGAARIDDLYATDVTAASGNRAQYIQIGRPSGIVEMRTGGASMIVLN